MASYTPNLDLLKKSPVTDGDDMFNVETMLNENWDRIDRGVGDYTTPAQKMGLTGDLSVGASLGVLANIGNVHMWRKTVVTEEEIPAGYTLGPVEANKVLAQSSSNWGNSYAAFTVASSITVDDGGNVTMNDTSGVEIWQGYFDPNKGENNLLGKFIQFSHVSADHISSDLETGVYFIPSNATFIRDHSSAPFYTKISACQKVNAYPLTPAGTHITYLTSTNRNAYQEGDDAKEAGYVLGDMVNGKFAVSIIDDGNESQHWLVGDAINVDSSGNISIPNFTSVYIRGAYENDKDYWQRLVGKFAIPQKDGSSFVKNEAYFFPEDATGGRDNTPFGAYAVWVDRYQKVTGYPAIPAGITIEYLGVLGDKIRMQIVSYIGTGTSGEATPCSITADFKFKTAEYLGSLRGGSLSPAVTYIDARDKVLSEAITTEFTAYSGFCLDDSQDSFGKKSEDGKTITWYSRYNNRQSNQLNEAGVKYYFRFFG